ncbi:NAD(P)H-binding protein [Actinopolymorpha pittospori]|uniref:Uncharacterized protein YbjT (DUF2867 family) n=1 Tax=Actinopolymorpha pittospori TaxID=648752 RepID=A0A927MNB8_9ACTN|nr:NAD(P)H-binding protein [Actinopolymorpha pittospori]MBE1603861.1 uncharacterized protein YbjT (DUF2867 family) [Actinopolymorpha pittospori]
MLLVTGATGTVGRPLVDALIDAGVKVRAVSRNPLAAAMPAGVDVAEGDPSRPHSIAAALHGVTTVFLNPAALGGSAGELLALARERGVRRVVLLSALAVEAQAQPPNLIATHHRAVEDALLASDLDWVILRPGMFAANTLLQWAAQIRAGNIVRGPFASSTDAPIHESDLAAVAARALLDDERSGQRILLTGPQSLTREQMVATIGQVIGRPLRYQEIPAEAAKRNMVAHGMPEQMVDTMLSLWAAGAGHPAAVETGVQSVLGRRPRSYAEWVADHAAAFTG